MAALRGNRLTNRPSKKNMGQNKGVNRYHRNVKKKKIIAFNRGNQVSLPRGGGT